MELNRRRYAFFSLESKSPTSLENSRVNSWIKIIDKLEAQQLRWADHVARMEEYLEWILRNKYQYEELG